MNCITCNKYLKRGHGINQYYYRGVYHYYCSMCLKVRNYRWTVSQRSKKYSSMATSFALGLAGLISLLSYRQVSRDLAWVPFALASLPIIIAIFIWFTLLEPKLKQTAKAEWKPLEKEQERLNALESYVISLKYSNQCLCEKCLVEEWTKRKK